ncbi:MAG: class I SAM-dependent methyltransferase [Cyanosarcina radialis HA8281-LM2]|nr:class I SAM-dependent methyltransferase [Cyanosarcina radialis HA8281-LM2]
MAVNLHQIKQRFYPYLQAGLSSAMSSLAQLRMKVITDSGTSIGLRRKLFEKVIPKGGVGVELGVYKGTLSKYILSANQPQCLHLVDPWWKYKSDWHWAIGDTSTVRSFASIVLSLQQEISAGKVEIHINGSKEVLKSFDNGYLDWAYVDSTHAYEQTKDELALLKDKVKPSGIIAGDDWQKDPSHRHHGVYRAVNEFLACEPTYQLIFQEGTQWAVTKSEGKN